MSMTTVPSAGPKTGFRGPWMALGIVAIVAIGAGLLVPQLLPGEMALEPSRPKADAKSKSKSEYVAPTVPEMPNPQGMLTRLASGTVLVLGLSVASIWGMRRWLKIQEPAGAGQRDLRLVETLALGNRCCLHLVHLGKREVLVGVDGAGIKTIVPLPRVFEEVLSETEMPASPARVNPDDPLTG
ncbi:MAG TPA: flagellar biosynthetic protein FliO [Gemmataceae bacterium]|jgi:flagellar biogenesis protein FliO|nr:flagellar biosynthetic protein FliO [Gemmataceae bacterium]